MGSIMPLHNRDALTDVACGREARTNSISSGLPYRPLNRGILDKRPIILSPSKDIHSFERGLKDRPGSALFELLFSHSGQGLPAVSHPFVRLPLLSFGRLRRPPLPFLRTTLIRNHLLHGSTPFRSSQPRSALSVFLHEDCG